MMHAALPGAVHHLDFSLPGVNPYLCQLTPDRRIARSHQAPCPYSNNGHRKPSPEVKQVLPDLATPVPFFVAVETYSVHGQPFLGLGHQRCAAASRDLIEDLAPDRGYAL